MTTKKKIKKKIVMERQLIDLQHCIHRDELLWLKDDSKQRDEIISQEKSYSEIFESKAKDLKVRKFD